MTREERAVERRRKRRQGLCFVMAIVATLLLDLPGLWLIPAAAFSLSLLLLFLHSVRGGCRRVPATRAENPKVGARTFNSAARHSFAWTEGPAGYAAYRGRWRSAL